MVACLAFALAACNQHRHEPEQHDDHEDSFNYTAYSEHFELFVEADPFIAGETASILAHFSSLSDFKAVEAGKITAVLTMQGRESRQTPGQPTRKGIYRFDVKPETAGKGSLRFEIANEKGQFEVILPEVIVFGSHAEAHEAAEENALNLTNTTVFTKEQSWKIDFATAFPETEPFGEVVKTTAQVQSSQKSERIITANMNGIVMLAGDHLSEGKLVEAGQVLFSISGSGLADNNMAVRFTEAKNNFEKAEADYERARELVKDKIVSEKDFLAAKNQFDNAKAVYDNLNKNFSASGQRVSSPVSGYLKQLLVKNGSYVEAGQAVLIISQDKTLILRGDVPQRHAPVLAFIESATISTLSGETYSLDDLNGRVLSYGKSVNSENYMIPVTLQVDNRRTLTTGSFVEIFLKTATRSKALTIPNSALLEEQGIYFVWVQTTPELFEKREVSLGKTDGLKSEVLKGITQADRIVTRGAMLIKLAQATGTLDAHSGHVH